MMGRRVGPGIAEVAIFRGDPIGPAIDSALEHLAVEPVVRGKVVAIKPNDTWASSHDITGVTQADTLRATIRFIKRFGPQAVVVSGGAGAAQTEEVFHHAGLMTVVREEHCEYFDHNRGPFVEVELPYALQRAGAGAQRTIRVNPRVLQYDTIVSLAQLKVHETATVTLSLKNIAMSFPAADYYGHPRATQQHEHAFFDDMHAFIAAMAKRFPIGLAIIVGHPAMVGTGPLGGRTVESGLVIASTDALAADVVGARLLGVELQGVRHLWEAARLGLGQADRQKMRFIGMGLDEAVAAFTEAAYGRPLSLTHA